jgi:DNA-directed RNA polymerase sigma subunit (sigma70/sigma32)
MAQREADGAKDTCALDVAARGPSTLDEIAALLGLTRERVRQVAEIGFRKFARHARVMRLGREAWV